MVAEATNLQFDYAKYGFRNEEKYLFKAPKGLNEQVVRELDYDRIIAMKETAIKIANNFVLGCAIEAMGEGMSLATCPRARRSQLRS